MIKDLKELEEYMATYHKLMEVEQPLYQEQEKDSQTLLDARQLLRSLQWFDGSWLDNPPKPLEGKEKLFEGMKPFIGLMEWQASTDHMRDKDYIPDPDREGSIFNLEAYLKDNPQ